MLYLVTSDRFLHLFTKNQNEESKLLPAFPTMVRFILQNSSIEVLINQARFLIHNNPFIYLFSFSGLGGRVFSFCIVSKESFNNFAGVFWLWFHGDKWKIVDGNESNDTVISYRYYQSPMYSGGEFFWVLGQKFSRDFGPNFLTFSDLSGLWFFGGHFQKWLTPPRAEKDPHANTRPTD